MQYQSQYQTPINSYDRQFANTTMNALQQNPFIDKGNISLLISNEYLRNYTYLEYCIFPQLFPLYLDSLDSCQLKSLMDSYLSTFMEFFVQGTNFEISYQGTLWDSQFVKFLEDKVLEKKIDQKYIQPEQDEENVQTQLQAMALEVDRLKQNLSKGQGDTNKSILLEIAHKIDFLQPKYQLPGILKKINQNQIANPLFNLICTLIKHMISNNCHSSLTDFPRCKYIIHAALWKISRESVLINDKTSSMKEVVDLLQVRIVPMEMELSEFMGSVRRGETKDSCLVGLESMSLDMMGVYLSLLRLVKSVDGFIQAFRQNENKQQYKQIPHNSKSTVQSPLSQIIETLQTCIKTSQQKNYSSRQQLQRQHISRRNIEMMKDLSYENVQKIAKLVSRISLSSGTGETDNREGMEMESRDVGRRMKSTSARKRNAMRDYDIKRLLDSKFLLGYKQLYSLLDEGTEIDITTINSGLSQKQHNTKRIINLIQTLFQETTNSITHIYRLTKQPLQQTIQTLQSVSYECSLLIQAITFFQDSINRHSNKLQVRQKLSKLKSSLLTNVLTLKVLLSAFSVPKNSNSVQVKLIKELQSYELIREMEQISAVFGQVMSLSIEASKSIKVSMMSSQQPLQQRQQVTTLPFLESILLLFGSIQLWYQLSVSHNNSNNNSSCQQTNQTSTINNNHTIIVQFMQQVIKQYSQQSVKIDSQQIVYVERILTLLQVFQGVDASSDLVKVNQLLGKLCQMKLSKGLMIGDVVNCLESMDKMLQVMSVKILAGCFPNSLSKDSSSQAMEQGFSQVLYKLSFWKFITLNRSNSKLNRQQIVQFILQNVIQPQRATFTINSNKQQANKTTIVNIDQSSLGINNIKNISTVIMKSSGKQSISQWFQMFVEVKQKYLKLIQYKNQLQLRQQQQQTSGKDNELIKQLTMSGYIFEKERQQSMKFYYTLVEHMYLSFRKLNQLNSQLDSFYGNNQHVTQLILQQLYNSLNQINTSTTELLTSMLSQLIHPKLYLFKPSPQQLVHILASTKLSPTQQNKEKLNEKISIVQKYYQHLIQLGIFGLAFVTWVKMEIKAKIQLLQKNCQKNTSCKQKKNQGKQYKVSSTFYLLQTITLLSLCDCDNFQINFSSIESYLQSSIQLIPKPQQQLSKASQQQPLMSSHEFPPLPINSNQVHTHIRHLGSFQFLQFVYEFIPFDITSEEQEVKLFNSSMDYALNQDNHQFLNLQKTQKIKFNRLSHYLQHLLRKY